MLAYYNEHDPFAAAWLRELMADGLIAPGIVDERSIEDVTPSELAGFRQCHFFAGIGVWSLALRQAGWPDDRPIWTGSCPCQPFSAAGKGGGFADERHLWPAFFHLIEQCRPAVVIGEQVASKDGLAWLDLVQADLEGAGYTSGALDTCAAGFGAPHIRQRLYWVAHANERGQPRPRVLGRPGDTTTREDRKKHRTVDASRRSRLVDPASGGRRERGDAAREGRSGHADRADDAPSGLADAGIAASERDARAVPRAQTGIRSARKQHGDRADGPQHGRADSRPGPTNGLWRAADWLGCRDGKWRPVAPGTFPLAPAGTVRNRVGTLRGAGNALNVAQAEGFLRAVASVLDERVREIDG